MNMTNISQGTSPAISIPPDGDDTNYSGEQVDVTTIKEVGDSSQSAIQTCFDEPISHPLQVERTTSHNKDRHRRHSSLSLGSLLRERRMTEATNFEKEAHIQTDSPMTEKALSQLTLDQIHVDERIQSRVETNHDMVSEYADLLSQQPDFDFPPIMVFHDGKTYLLGSGFHRFQAYKKASRKTIPCEVRSGGEREAILHSVGANATHGLRRTNADKRKAVMMVLQMEDWKDLPTREIGDMCAVSHNFVADVKKSLSSDYKDADQGGGNGSGKRKTTSMNHSVAEQGFEQMKLSPDVVADGDIKLEAEHVKEFRSECDKLFPLVDALEKDASMFTLLDDQLKHLQVLIFEHRERLGIAAPIE